MNDIHEQVERHIPLVHSVARKMGRRVTAVEHEELVHFGMLGLLQAAEAFDYGRGLAFSTFAVPRIRGAMLDELRRLDPRPRSIRALERRINQAVATAGNTLGREPSSRDVAELLGVSLAEYDAMRQRVEIADTWSLDEPSRSRDADTFGDTVESDANADDAAIAHSERQWLWTHINRLTARDREVIVKYYFEEVQGSELAAALGCTQSNVTHLRQRAIAKLRELMAA